MGFELGLIMKRVYSVAVNKCYFPESKRPADRFTSFQEVWKIKAGDRLEAIATAWALHGARILAEIREDVRAVSIDANNPPKQRLMGRLNPVRVWNRIPRFPTI